MNALRVPCVRRSWSCCAAVFVLYGLLLAAPAFGQSSKISEVKQKLIVRLSKKFCDIAKENDFYRIKKLLENAGKHYLGEAITVEEAYPYIGCNEPNARNIRLLRLPAEYSHLKLFFVDLLIHFYASAPGKTFLRKIVKCKHDFGHGCMDVFEHIQMNRRKHSHPGRLKKFDTLERQLLYRLLDPPGPVRDPGFCREVLDEPRYCQTQAKGDEIGEAATRAIWEVWNKSTVAQRHLAWVSSREWARSAAIFEVFTGSIPAVAEVQHRFLDFDYVCKEQLGLSPEACAEKEKDVAIRRWELEKEQPELITEAKAKLEEIETRLRELCSRAPNLVWCSPLLR